MSVIPLLQSEVQNFFHLQEELARIKAHLKQTNQLIKESQDRILEYMETSNIDSCSSCGFVLSVQDKKRLPTTTSKVIMTRIKEYFRIPEEQITTFLETLKDERTKNCQYYKCLVKKTLKGSAVNSTTNNPAPTTASDIVADDATEGTALSEALDDMYN